jgi:hypothetical protein
VYTNRVRKGRGETKRRLIGFTLPSVLGIGGGGANWEVTPGDRAMARSVLQVLEDRRVLYDSFQAEDPSDFIKSVELIRTGVAPFIKDSQSPELRDPLRAIQAACRQFLTEVHESNQALGPFYQALGSLRARVGISVAVIIETFDIDVDEHLAKLMPPPVDENDT